MLCLSKTPEKKQGGNMKIAQILALFVCIILIAVCGITDAGEKKLLNLDVPLPDDITIVAPAEDVPKDIAAFSGVWEGIWVWNRSKGVLIVEEINSKEAKVIISRGKGQGIYTQPGNYERYKAIVTPENLKLEFSYGENQWYTFSMQNNLSQIKGTIKDWTGTEFDIIMTKIK
jgi:hypothetical protein